MQRDSERRGSRRGQNHGLRCSPCSCERGHECSATVKGARRDEDKTTASLPPGSCYRGPGYNGKGGGAGRGEDQTTGVTTPGLRCWTRTQHVSDGERANQR